MNPWEISIQRLPGRTTLALYIFRRGHNGKTEVVQGNDTIVTFDEGQDFEPTITLFPEMLSVLMKELSEYGVRLPEQSFIEGKLYATDKHLEDMRRLVFEGQDREMVIEGEALPRNKTIVIKETYASETEEENRD